MNDTRVSEVIRNSIRDLFSLPPLEGFVKYMTKELEETSRADPDAVLMFLFATKTLIENNDSRPLDQPTKSPYYKNLVRILELMCAFYTPITPPEL